MKEIGGYFELELPFVREYHNKAIRLNSGRNAFEYILRARKYKKVYLPFYTCDVMLEPIIKLSLSYEFYPIDSNLHPIFDFNKISKDEVFVYNNYFGICEEQIRSVSKQTENLIIDNSQAFYYKAIPGIDTFYSPRKFFGVPDGGYLYTSSPLEDEFEKDLSYNRFSHLIGRIDQNAGAFYQDFVNNDNSLNNQPVKQMSVLTQRLLSSIDYDTAAEKRKVNFNYLHDEFSKINQLKVEVNHDIVPMVYPLLIENGEELKRQLIQNKIFVATYWPNVLDWSDKNSFEYNLTRSLLTLPIDQRYNTEDINKIIEIIKWKK